jgi:hypothetical protein
MTAVAETKTKGKNPLPKGWRWLRLKDVMKINLPRPGDSQRVYNSPSPFVPMEAIDEVTGRTTKQITRPFGKIRQGYTFFPRLMCCLPR